MYGCCKDPFRCHRSYVSQPITLCMAPGHPIRAEDRNVGPVVIRSIDALQGIVTNATDVKPLLTVATYLDNISGLEVYQEVVGASNSVSTSFTPGI